MIGRFGVKVANRSKFPTRAVGALFRAALRAHGMPARTYCLSVLPGYHSKMANGATLGACGRAHLGSLSGGRLYQAAMVWMAAPLGEVRSRRFGQAEWNMDLSTARGFARWCWILDHEIMHLKGATDAELDRQHDPMVNTAMGRLSNSDVPCPPAWALGFEALEPKAVKAAPTADDLRTKRIERAEARLKKATTDLKRATTIANRWRRKLAALRRFERLAAEKGTP